MDMSRKSRKYTKFSGSISGEYRLVNGEIIKDFGEAYRNKSLKHYTDNIFNFDECCLFLSQKINKKLVLNEDDISSGKLSKETLNVLFCSSLEGEKLKRSLQKVSHHVVSKTDLSMVLNLNIKTTENLG